MNTYAKNATYNTTTHPQPEDHYESLLSQKHESEYLKYGPPPRNFYALRMRSSKRGQCVLYADHSIDDTVTTFKDDGRFDHPLSPIGLESNPNVFTEFTDTRPDYPGFFHPPMEYTPGQTSWQHHETWQAALTTAMLAKGVKVKGDDGQEMPISVRDEV